MAVSMLLAIACAIPAIFLFWTFSSTNMSPFSKLYNKRICLLIAHPDDEAMFFAPTVLALTKPQLGNHLKILCLSSGDADGLGHVRKNELQKSALQLGLRNESDVFVVDDPARFPDSMTKMWSETDVSSLLASAFAPDLAASSGVSSGSSTSSSLSTTTTGAAARRHNSSSSSSSRNKQGKPPFATIDILITFDQHGVSQHPNHRSLYHGAIHFLHALMKDKSGFSCPVTLYTLTTTNILRKYAGIFDAPLTMLLGAVDAISYTFSRGRGNTKTRNNNNNSRIISKKDGLPHRLLFVSSVMEWITAQKAMVKGHQSQMVWFRWGWITIGRYMTVNDLKREVVGF